MKKTTKELLIEGRALLVNGFTQGVYARNKEGHKVDHSSPTAVCFCSIGALRKARRISRQTTLNSQDPYYIASACLRHAMDDNVIDYNDSHSKEEVIAKWDEAIEHCE